MIKVALWATNMSAPIHDRHDFGEFVVRAMRKAKSNGADILLCPEWMSMLMLSYAPPLLQTEELSWLHDECWPAHDALLQTAKEIRLGVVLGTWPHCNDDGEISNMASFYLPSHDDVPEQKIYQVKANPTVEERDKKGWMIKPGNGLVHCLTYRGKKIAVSICHDNSVAAWARTVAVEEPDIVLAPSMTETESHVDGHKFIFDWCQKRSAQWGCIVLAVGAVGTQRLKTRTEPNVGGAAYYNAGLKVGEFPPRAETTGDGPMMFAVVP